MVPVYVSAALAFGLMFLSLVMNPTNYKSGDSIATITNNSKSEYEHGGQTFQFGSGPNAISLITIGNYDQESAAETFAMGE